MQYPITYGPDARYAYVSTHRNCRLRVEAGEVRLEEWRTLAGAEKVLLAYLTPVYLALLGICNLPILLYLSGQRTTPWLNFTPLLPWLIAWVLGLIPLGVLALPLYPHRRRWPKSAIRDIRCHGREVTLEIDGAAPVVVRVPDPDTVPALAAALRDPAAALPAPIPCYSGRDGIVDELKFTHAARLTIAGETITFRGVRRVRQPKALAIILLWCAVMVGMLVSVTTWLPMSETTAMLLGCLAGASLLGIVFSARLRRHITHHWTRHEIEDVQQHGWVVTFLLRDADGSRRRCLFHATHEQEAGEIAAVLRAAPGEAEQAFTVFPCPTFWSEGAGFFGHGQVAIDGDTLTFTGRRKNYLYPWWVYWAGIVVLYPLLAGLVHATLSPTFPEREVLIFAAPAMLLIELRLLFGVLETFLIVRAQPLARRDISALRRREREVTFLARQPGGAFRRRLFHARTEEDARAIEAALR